MYYGASVHVGVSSTWPIFQYHISAHRDEVEQFDALSTELPLILIPASGADGSKGPIGQVH